MAKVFAIKEHSSLIIAFANLQEALHIIIMYYEGKANNEFISQYLIFFQHLIIIKNQNFINQEIQAHCIIIFQLAHMAILILFL